MDLSPPTVMERVKKLKARGIIKGYHALLDAKKIGRDIVAFIGVSIGHQRHIISFASYRVSDGVGGVSYLLKLSNLAIDSSCLGIHGSMLQVSPSL